MPSELWAIATVLIILFGFVVFFGAPYVPTHRKRLQAGLDLLDMSPGDLLVDLGSGDGRVLLAAAKRGWRATGYELNPVLNAIVFIRSLSKRDAISIYTRNFWVVRLPDDTEAVYFFGAGPLMDRFAKRLEQIMATRTTPLQVLSYGFEVPGLKPIKQIDGYFLYRLEPIA